MSSVEFDGMCKYYNRKEACRILASLFFMLNIYKIEEYVTNRCTVQRTFV